LQESKLLRKLHKQHMNTSAACSQFIVGILK